MSARCTLPIAADPRRPMPDHAGARVDVIETALRVLGEEDRRLGRLGLDGARDRFREARRYWGFVGALVHMSDEPLTGSLRLKDGQ